MEYYSNYSPVFHNRKTGLFHVVTYRLLRGTNSYAIFCTYFVFSTPPTFASQSDTKSEMQHSFELTGCKCFTWKKSILMNFSFTGIMPQTKQSYDNTAAHTLCKRIIDSGILDNTPLPLV